MTLNNAGAIEGDYKLQPIIDKFGTSKQLYNNNPSDCVFYYTDLIINHVNQQGGQASWQYLGYELVLTTNGDNLQLEVMKNGLITNMTEVDNRCPIAFVAERICTFTKSNYVNEDSKMSDIIWLTTELIESINSTPFFTGH